MRLLSASRSKRPSVAYVGRVLLVVFFLIMATALAYYLYSFSLAADSRGWPEAQGTVERSTVKGGWQGRSGTPLWQRLRRLDVEVVYRVGERSYRCSRLSFFGSLLHSEPDVERLLASLSPGQVVPVHYDPAAPDRCVLIPG